MCWADTPSVCLNGIVCVYIPTYMCVLYMNCTNYRQCLPWSNRVPDTETTCVVKDISLPCTVYRITNTLTHTHTHRRRCAIHWHYVALAPRSCIGDHVTVCPQPLVMTTHREWNVCVPVSENTIVMTLKMCSSCMLQWIWTLWNCANHVVIE